MLTASITTYPLTKASMYSVRFATVSDSAIIARQRCAMFQDNGISGSVSFPELESESTLWLQRHLADGSYVGWLTEKDGDVIAGAGVWFMEWPPHYLDVNTVRGYLLNFYVNPTARGNGLAKELLGLATAECRNRAVRVAVLHASAMGRPVYEKEGWAVGNEMMMRLNQQP